MIPPAPWEIRNLDLADGCSALEVTEANAVRLFIRLDDVVLGVVNFLRDDLPLEASELASIVAEAIGRTVLELFAYGSISEARAWAQRGFLLEGTRNDVNIRRDGLAKLRALVAERRRRAVKSSVSIIICTRGRADHLAECLKACACQLSKGREILVVDNGPDKTTQEVVASFPGVRYVVEPTAGLSRARNAGVRAANGEIIVFTDDDVRPEPGWIEGLLLGFADPETALTTGLVVPAELRSDAQIAFEFGLGFGGMGFVPLRFDSVSFSARLHVGAPVDSIGAGANMAIRRVVVEELGYFDERIGPGAFGGCADDSEFWYRLLAAGYTARYEPFSIVRHVHRADMDALKRLTRDYFIGCTASFFLQYLKHGHRGNIRRALIALPKSFIIQFIRNSLRRWRGEFDFLFWPKLNGFLRGLSFLPIWFFKIQKNGKHLYRIKEH